MIYESVDKTDEEHAWLNAVIFNAHGPKEDGDPWQISDFRSFSKEEPTPESNEQYTKTWMDNFKKRIQLMG